MKKLLIILLAGMLSVGVTACGNKDDGKTQGGEATSGQTQNSAPDMEDDTTGNTGIDISNGWSGDMQTVKQAIVDTLGDNYWPNTPIIPEMLEGTYGISADMYEDYLAESPMISANVDTLILVKAKEDTVGKVEEALTAYRENLVNDTMQYPMNLGKIQASRIERIGNYVCFVQLGGDINMDASDEEIIAECQEQNELAIAVIEQNVKH